jgi:NAD(P)-dependent dehydrogenase (short-subunit alcohol dehydrogenase family)
VPVTVRLVMAPPGAVLITGAGGHLGRRIAQSMAKRSLRVAVNDVDAISAERLAHSIGGGSVPFAADVSDYKSAYSLVADVAGHFGTIDVLINAAGSEGPIGAIEDLNPASVKHTFDVNVMSVFWMCAAVVPGMKQRRLGRIVNIASGAGLAGGELASPYHASKHAVVGLTRSLARELAPHQIAVNALCPGYVDSPMVERILTSMEGVSGRKTRVIESIPAGRMASPEEVASTATFLALDAPLYLTGAAIVLDGGLRA